jgi:hypothetical protein
MVPTKTIHYLLQHTEVREAWNVTEILLTLVHNEADASVGWRWFHLYKEIELERENCDLFNAD